MGRDEKKDRLYRKELWSTILFALLFFAMVYTVFIFVLFPDLKVGYILGFPTHYAITLFFGWIGLIIATYIYAKVASKFDQELEELSAELSKGSEEKGGE